MTDYFEIHERDGAARLGELRLDSPLWTPALADDVTRDAGSLWTAERDAPAGDDSALTVLPHRAFPAGTREEVVDAFAADPPEIDGPSAAVITADAPDAGGAASAPVDAYVLSNAHGVVGHASAFVDAVIDVREAVPADTALYLSGVATPLNVATLAYAGVDLVDAKRARVKGSRGLYLTDEAERFLADLDELPCSCPACQVPREEFDRAACEAHNVNALAAELRRVRRRIREGRLRDYVEGQARYEQWLTATLREFDQQYGYVETRAPVARNNELAAATGDTLRRPEIQRFAERVSERYVNRFRNPLVLVPCSARKPYSESQSHDQFHDAIQFRGHLASMTSPIGVVPQELELTYPAQHYDTVVTGRWSEDEKRFVAEVLERYLRRNDYPRVIAHVPADGYREICERVEDRVDLPFEYTVEDHPTTTESLGNLMSTLDGELKYTKRERQHNTVRAIADYMLGDGAGDDLFDELNTRSRYPKLQVRDDDGELLATMVPTYGALAFTLAGARRWAESDAPTRTVEIDSFVPQGSVLAPGVVDADDGIRVGDEVVVEGPRAFAVGRAEMHGAAMRSSTRGVAVDVRHSAER
ncbi:tRNA-ribosyltransferase [Halobacteriales archaeon QS_6_71_20]|nr:MAG: tRNA-ribosyltransferase [Halobacteriales archaeon QS_6_71_20]